MKYTRNNKEFACSGYFKDKSLFKIVCLYENGDTMLIDTYSNDKRNGISKQFYENGQVKEKGMYENSAKIEKWHEYYPNGLLKSFEYRRLLDGKSQLYYRKKYNEQGELDSLIYPLEYRTDNIDSVYKVGKQYLLNIELMYTEYDSIHVWGLRDLDFSNPGYEDTVSFYGNNLQYEFTPEKPGKHTIEGILMELDASKLPDPGAYGGDRPFKFEYEAVE